MFGISISQISKICNGTVFNSLDDQLEPLRIVIDSRNICPGDLFAALKGEKVDGHNFIQNAFDRGAICCLAERFDPSINGTTIIVESVQNALEKIASAFRSTLGIPFIGITGSVGKTTAKEMISSVLNCHYPVYKTEKNLNNQLGVPISVSSIHSEHMAAVIEMGVSKIGDMDLLGRIVRPNIAVFTNIGHAHLEYLKSLEGVFKEKTSVLQYMPTDGYAVINGDDELLASLHCNQGILSYGFRDDCDVRVNSIQIAEDGLSSDFNIIYKKRELHVHVPAYGKHIVYASLMGASVGFILGLSDEEIIRGIQSYQTVGRRANVIKTRYLTLIDDCYNANPDSVKNAIDSLVSLSGRKVCVLGDMLELGPDSPAYHYEVGKYAYDKGVDLIIAEGKYSENIVFAAGNRGIHFKSKSDMCNELPNLLKAGDKVMVKASLGSGFESISEYIKHIK